MGKRRQQTQCLLPPFAFCYFSFRLFAKLPCHGCFMPQNMRDFFKGVFLINLARRPDRLQDVLSMLQRCDWPFREPVVIKAVDGNCVPTPEGWLAGSGAWGCARSHIRILEDCIQNQTDPILILEDDIIVRNSFREDCERFFNCLLNDWSALWLGGQHHSQPRSVKPGIVLASNVQRTHGYAARGAFLRALYAHWSRPAQVQHIDWDLGVIQKRFKVYCPQPFLFGQSRSQSDINGRVSPAKFWQPPKGDEPIFLLDCDRETMEGLREYCIHTGYDRGPDGIDNGLRLVFQSGDVKRKLRKWIDELQWECVSCEGMILGVWHPQATVELLRECWRGPVHVVRSLDDAMPHFQAGSWNPANAAESIWDN